jgi:GNAT superfamily N-acetyltransferase
VTGADAATPMREVTVDELDAVAALCRKGVWGAPGPGELAAALFPADHTVEVVGSPDDGVAAWWQDGDRAWVRLLVVAADRRRAGLGRELLSEVGRRVGPDVTIYLGGDPLVSLWPGIVGTDVALLAVAESCGYRTVGASVAMEAELRGPRPPDPGGWRIATAQDERALASWWELKQAPGWREAARALADDAMVVVEDATGSVRAICTFDTSRAATFGPLVAVDDDALRVAVVAAMRSMRTRGHVRAEVSSAAPVRLFASVGFHVSKVYLRSAKAPARAGGGL